MEHHHSALYVHYKRLYRFYVYVGYFVHYGTYAYSQKLWRDGQVYDFQLVHIRERRHHGTKHDYKHYYYGRVLYDSQSSAYDIGESDDKKIYTRILRL